MQQNDPDQFPQINLEHLATAFKIMRQNFVQSPNLTQANEYFNTCEKNPQFSFCLMKLFNQANDPILKQQTLGLLKNVIKRNWTSRRRSAELCYLSADTKTKIRDGVLELYKIHWQHYYKIFNQIFQYVGRQDFPSNYLTLYDFIKNVLAIMAQYNIQQILIAKELLPYLSTVKKVLKEYGIKRITHNQQQYKLYIEPILQLCGRIFEKIGHTLTAMAKNQVQINFEMSRNLLECSRKIDKIMMYGIQATTPEMQKDNFLNNLLQMLTQKLQYMVNFPNQKHQDEIQKNIQALVEGLSKIQSLYPFLISKFLSNYLHVIINLLFHKSFSEYRLLNAIIKANKKPLATYSYYIPPEQFASSIYCRKGTENLYQKQQAHCHGVFLEIYGGNNCNMMLEKIVSQLMIKYQRENEDDEMIFEDAENITEPNQDPFPFDLIIQLARDVLLRFRDESKQFIVKVFQHLLNTNQSSSSSPLILAMHQIILLLPRIYDQPNMDLQSVYALMQKAYSMNDFKVFSRYIRNYQAFFSISMLQKAFQILVNIVSQQNMPHQIVYQSAVCIKKLLNENQEENLSVENMGGCLGNIFRLLNIYQKEPNHLWNLLHLLNQIFKALSNQTILVNIPLIINNIDMMIDNKNNGIVVLEAITDLLENVIDILAVEKNETHIQLSFQSNILCVKHIEQAFMIFMKGQQQLGSQSIFRLWLIVMKNHEVAHSTQQFNQKLIGLFQNLQKYAIEESPILFCEIIEQYMLSNLFVFTSDNLMEIFRMVKRDIESQNEPRVILSIFSVYYTYSLLTNTYIPEIMTICMQQLRNLTNKISPSFNALRTELMLILGYHLVSFGCQNIFGLFNSCWPSYIDWFWPIVWGLDYVNHRYACKTLSIALINSVDYFDVNALKNSIEGHFPIDNIVKFLLSNLEPLKTQQAYSSYMNSLRIALHTEESFSKRHRSRGLGKDKGPNRKIYLHVKGDWSQSDLTDLFRSKMLPIFNSLNWGPDDLDERFTKQNCKKLIQILN